MKPIFHPISFCLGFSQESHTVSTSKSLINTSIYIYIYAIAEEIAEFPPTSCRVEFQGSLISLIVWALSYRSLIELNLIIAGDDNAHIFIDMHKHRIKWEVCKVWLSKLMQFLCHYINWGISAIEWKPFFCLSFFDDDS